MDKDAKGRFVKGSTSWLKGKKGLTKNPLKGKKMPEEWKQKLRKPRSIKRIWTDADRDKLSKYWIGKRTGKDSPRWKGGKSVRPNNIRSQRLKNAEGAHTVGEWELLKKQYGATCPCCKKSEPEIKLTEDHIIPLSKGGSNYIENIQPLCIRCNTHKFTKIIKY